MVGVNSSLHKFRKNTKDRSSFDWVQNIVTYMGDRLQSAPTSA
jgi:hypothetical protein